MKTIKIYDTTLRDGTQAEGISLSLNDKLKIAKRLDQFGIHYIEGGWPGSNPKDMNFFKEVKKLKFKVAKVAAFGSTRRPHTKASDDANINFLLKAQTDVVTVFGKSWTLHVTDVFKTSLKENLSMIYDTVNYLKSKKKEVIFDAEHFFDGYNADSQYALDALRTAVQAGCDLVCLCDTNGGMLPKQIKDIIHVVKREIEVPLGIHCHNDSDLAVANSITALEEGCEHVQGTINGIGERCGNANLVSIIPIIQLKMGMKSIAQTKLEELTETSRYVSEVCNMSINDTFPFVGKSAFAHKGGVHVNAMMKNPETYEHIKPHTVGNKTRFLISELSGKTNILLKAKELDMNLDKETPETKEILQKVQDLENEGYQFEAAEASFELLMKKTLKQYHPFFELCGWRTSVEKREDGTVLSEATVKVKVKGQEELSAGSGDGPVNALDNAFRKALSKFYPIVNTIHLTDYKVRVIDSGAGTAARVRVFVQFRDEKNDWTTVGVSENIIEASWHALVEAIEYKLLKG
ncbi:MAG: citramalate synthase [Candidatus Omnitrophica bacterium]|nr:citramalate synthase [Candidatus Omnitrophota bacterium]